MKLLLFGDLHADSFAAEAIVAQSAGVDIVIGTGDFANAHRGLERCIGILRAITRPTVLVAGNNETPVALRYACRDWLAAHVLHGSSVTLLGLTCYGVGGDIPITPFGSWS